VFDTVPALRCTAEEALHRVRDTRGLIAERRVPIDERGRSKHDAASLLVGDGLDDEAGELNHKFPQPGIFLPQRLQIVIVAVADGSR